MTWIAVVLLGIAALAGLGFACAISTPRRPASDATYTSNALIAAGAVTGSAVCAIVAAVLTAGI
ncbi:putative protein OS=Tsukamurella paurometabola (strain ATCC 8368 / DSM / CCUG 35730 /CIP 100753 / JCM 10117 / KCTC 9821 / NBRC 16120 / NCIMB 702349/ NCTC 13040) OX=521096 GN=Tpau_3200 PE=4 SV=1 [Tsukamurella paurometabola]|uniref:Uncharacterized protein n=1 Tax=Tsukamurella paurometabola (strain ATCC 8368 / DSM 20162 / CCUG 35730 / CIP 100753 / JCM 10117 / KCTC 9821 / NBRC 16120 / NCIMB 702349 / NCTC 13040) TaxID=521096 RepID=D5UVK5_TSUPD|nr:hypothetical protein [Tsukamurella paurometabola]ADG79787.1 hypothetical protein Tpau_3200 [Tsukamurella paurometabola DSM 20162]SUP37224.1 Uncharacterised protein [Tsukamurella paurometabola]